MSESYTKGRDQCPCPGHFAFSFGNGVQVNHNRFPRTLRDHWSDAIYRRRMAVFRGSRVFIYLACAVLLMLTPPWSNAHLSSAEIVPWEEFLQRQGFPPELTPTSVLSGNLETIAGLNSARDKVFLWNRSVGIVELGDPKDITPHPLSGDGATFYFVRRSDLSLFRWTIDRGIEPYEPEWFKPSSRLSMQLSHDASRMLVDYYDDPNPTILWDDEHGKKIHDFPSLERHILSPDGTTVWATTEHRAGQGMTIVSWTEESGLRTRLPLPTPSCCSFVNSVSADGSVAVGRMVPPDRCCEEAFRIDDDGPSLIELPQDVDPNTIKRHAAGPVTASGDVVFGWADAHPWVWDEENGTRFVSQFLTEDYGLSDELADDLQLGVLDIAADGNVLVAASGLREGRWAVILNSVLGDFNSDGIINVTDINDLTRQSAKGLNLVWYDLTEDDLVNVADIERWIKSPDIFHSWIGDANLDGEFNTNDLVNVFQAGEYEDDEDLNSTWSTGDWNGDGDFGTSDLVLAFRDGGFEMGPREAVRAVPEPSGFAMLSIALVVLTVFPRRQCLKLRRKAV